MDKHKSMIKNLTKYYKNLSAPVKASLWFLICGFMQKGISFLTTPVFTRIMTEAEYGRFSVYNSWLSIVQIIISLNLAAGVYTKGLIKNEEDEDGFSSSMLGLSTTCILIWAVIYAVFHKQINAALELSTVLMTAMLIEIWAHTAYQFWSNRERVHYRYKKLVALTVAYITLRPLLGVYFVLMAETTHQVEARVFTTVGVNLLLFSGLFISILKKGGRFYDKNYWLYALKFNLPLLPHYLSQIVLNQSDRIMIGHICGSSEAAYYSVAYTLAMVLQIVNNSVSSTMNPWIYRTIKAGEYRKIGNVSYLILGVIAVLNLSVVLCAPELMLILAPESYQAAIWVIPPVTVSVYFSFLYNLFATFEMNFEKTHYVTIATIVGAVLNVILNAIFIPIYGFIAAGYTTLVCFVLYAFAHYYFMRKVVKIYLHDVVIYDVKLIIAIGAALLMSAGVVMLFYKMLLVRYGLLLLLIVMTVMNRDKLMSLLRMLKNKA